jgi:hypothetical protein
MNKNPDLNWTAKTIGGSKRPKITPYGGIGNHHVVLMEPTAANKDKFAQPFTIDPFKGPIDRLSGNPATDVVCSCEENFRKDYPYNLYP